MTEGLFKIAKSDAYRPNRRLGRGIVLSLLVFLVAVALLLWYVGVFGGNIRVVVPNQIYRSAQLTGDTLGNLLDQKHIRTIVNLRGGSAQDAWYRSELAESKRRGVVHIDVPLSAIKLPPPRQLVALLNAFDNAPRPILFHCQGGADRAGLTGTIYLNVYRNVPLDTAEKAQLTWRYGHMAFTRTRAMNTFFNLYRADGQKMPLRRWIETRYPAVYASEPDALKMKPADVRTPDPLPAARPLPHLGKLATPLAIR